MLYLTPLSEDRGRLMLPAYALAPYTYFHFAYGFDTRKLALAFDSFVRVSRRVYESRYGRIT
jgi:hypothetical protein